MAYEIIFIGYYHSDTPPTTSVLRSLLPCDFLPERIQTMGHGLGEMAHAIFRRWVLNNIRIIDFWYHSTDGVHAWYAEFDPADLSIIMLSNTYADFFMDQKDRFSDIKRVQPHAV